MNQNDKSLNGFFKEIKERLTVSQIANNFVQLIGSNGSFRALCPFHADSNPSLSIHDKKGVYKCFSCNTAGDLISFYANYKKISYYQAAIKINEEFNLGISINQNLSKAFKEQKKLERVYKINQIVSNLYTRFLKAEQNKDALAYLLKRGINQEIIDYFKIGYAPKENFINDYFLNHQIDDVDEFGTNDLGNWSLLSLNETGEWNDFFKNRIIFPICDPYNNIVGFSARSVGNYTPKYLNSKDSDVFKKQELLYNFNNVLKLSEQETNKIIIIVEGFMDAIALYKVGIKNVVATMGVALTTNHLELLLKHQFKNIIFCFDNDQAGISTTINQINKLADYNFNIFVVDQSFWNTKDVDEYILKYANDQSKIAQLINGFNEPLHISVYLMLNELKKINNNLNSITKINLQQAWKKIISNYGEMAQFDFYKQSFLDYLKIELSQEDVKHWLFNKQTYTKSIKQDTNRSFNQNLAKDISYKNVTEEYTKNKKPITKIKDPINDAKKKLEKAFYAYLLWILKINEVVINQPLKVMIFKIICEEINECLLFLSERNELVFLEILEWLHELLNVNQTKTISLYNNKQELIAFFNEFKSINNITHQFANELIISLEIDQSIVDLKANYTKRGHEFLINKFNIAFVEFKKQYLNYELKLENKKLVEITNQMIMDENNAIKYNDILGSITNKISEINSSKNSLEAKLKILNSNC
ncbi:DNA primase [Ureaplasma diversum]|uniref:DNA primase n=1 Tax=Ureaplasma diversum NCTC 246 TaxID=1188241 RepID=A0A084F1G7_9BACT|nr:DNA primase [Ureaplasma diversum]KEZ24059.1 DNA primase [Ureaplasma diversum NCTC 246]